MLNRTQNRPLGFAACALASMFWGCGFFFGKIALHEMNVGAMVLFRWTFACIALLPILLTHKPSFTKREWGELAIAWSFGVPLQFLLQFKGLSLTSVSHASLMVGTMPVILAVGATLFLRERLQLAGWISIAFSTAGAALIVMGKSVAGRGDAPTLRGDLYVVASLAIALVWVLGNKKLMAKHSALMVTAWGALLGTAILAVLTPMLYGLPSLHVSGKAWAASAAAGFLCTAASTALWNWGLTQVPASQAGVLLNMEPLIGSLLGVLVLGEQLGTAAYLGGAMIVVAAITLTVVSSRSAAAETFLVEMQ
ncbi:MAG: EamA family transporter [Acidobacteriaceae bacterium]|nr:EamA family transporter [Acidobacteriaceae bacterium]